jgi:hypothetical protein
VRDKTFGKRSNLPQRRVRLLRGEEALHSETMIIAPWASVKGFARHAPFVASRSPRAPRGP